MTSKQEWLNSFKRIASTDANFARVCEEVCEYDTANPAIHVSDCGYFSEWADGQYHLIIERSEWVETDINKIKDILWKEWAQDELSYA